MPLVFLSSSAVRTASFSILPKTTVLGLVGKNVIPTSSSALFMSSTTTTTTDNKEETTSSSSNDATTTTTTTTEGPLLPPVDKDSKRLFLVRHGEVINPGGDRPVYYGAMDVSLSPLGKQEAVAAAQYLSQHNLYLVACSPLSRAVYGANQVLTLQKEQQQPKDVVRDDDLVVLEGFTELDRGAWCGKTKEEIGQDAMNRFDACDESVTPVGGESFPALKRRVLAARDEILAQTPPGQASAVVSHLQVTRSMLSEALGIPTNQMAQLGIATASITCIDYHPQDTNDDNSILPTTVHFQSFKPNVGLSESKDGAN